LSSDWGVYLFNKEIKDYLFEKSDIEKTTFVQLAKEHKLKAFRYFGFWRTVNNFKDLERLEEDLKALGVK